MMKVVRSRRKTLAIQILGVDKICVKAPLLYPDFLIQKFIDQKQAWISKKQAIFQSHVLVNQNFSNQASFLYLGNIYLLNYTNQSDFSFSDKYLDVPSNIPLGRLKISLKEWLLSSAQDILFDRLSQKAIDMSLQPKEMKLSNAKTRWGSCNSRAVIRLNWRLIFAPIYVIDYLAIHELAHLEEMNHSADFWSIVKRYDASYNLAENWLKQHQSLLETFR
eukprot:COSAG01_NODE_662_length_14431_cov_31.385775_10_plen_220_part_00